MLRRLGRFESMTKVPVQPFHLVTTFYRPGYYENIHVYSWSSAIYRKITHQCSLCINIGPRFNLKTDFAVIRLRLQRKDCHDRLIFIMGIVLLVTRTLNLKTASWSQSLLSLPQQMFPWLMLLCHRHQLTKRHAHVKNCYHRPMVR